MGKLCVACPIAIRTPHTHTQTPCLILLCMGSASTSHSLAAIHRVLARLTREARGGGTLQQGGETVGSHGLQGARSTESMKHRTTCPCSCEARREKCWILADPLQISEPSSGVQALGTQGAGREHRHGASGLRRWMLDFSPCGAPAIGCERITEQTRQESFLSRQVS